MLPSPPKIPTPRPAPSIHDIFDYALHGEAEQYVSPLHVWHRWTKWETGEMVESSRRGERETQHRICKVCSVRQVRIINFS